jgi:hypothetical protein
VCTRSGAGGGTSGGKSRRDTPGAGLGAEAGGYVPLQAQLVPLDREQVVAALLDDLRAQVALAEQRVAEEDPPRDRQDAQQLQGGLVLVGLGIDLDLGEDGLVPVGIGGDQVLTGRLAVAAAA